MSMTSPTASGANTQAASGTIRICASVSILCLALACCGWSASRARQRAASTSPAASIRWREHRIDDEGLSGVPLRGADGLAMADLDRDGHRDIVSVHEDSSHVRIAFGTGAPDRWVNITLASGPGVGAVEDVACGDLNGDKRPDIVVACENGHVAYFEAPPDPRQPGPWKSAAIAKTRGRGSWIRVGIADLDADGRPEILAANKGGTAISYFRPALPAAGKAPWEEEVTLAHCKEPINVAAVDIDRDRDLDIVAASRGERKIFLLENLGRGREWRERAIHSGLPRSEGFMFEFADLNRDGRTDIVTEEEHAGQVFWLEQPATAGGAWRPHVIGTTAPDHATGLGLADINGDKRLDLMVGGYSQSPGSTEPPNISPTDRCGRLAWFEQPADPKSPWRPHEISRRRRGMFDQFVPVDFNRDGLLDFITTRGNSGSFDGVLWLEQVRSSLPGPIFQPARPKDSAEVPLPPVS